MNIARSFLLSSLVLAYISCTPDGTSRCYIQVCYNPALQDPYSIEQLSVTILEKGIIGNELHEISCDDYYLDDFNYIYLADVTTRGCCSADIEITFSEPENTIVSGVFTIPLKSDVQLTINIYPYRTPFFYICDGNEVFPVDEEDRATYGDSLFVKWDMVEIE